MLLSAVMYIHADAMFIKDMRTEIKTQTPSNHRKWTSERTKRDESDMKEPKVKATRSYPWS